jgi:hypothetical protein
MPSVPINGVPPVVVPPEEVPLELPVPEPELEPVPEPVPVPVEELEPDVPALVLPPVVVLPPLVVEPLVEPPASLPPPLEEQAAARHSDPSARKGAKERVMMGPLRLKNVLERYGRIGRKGSSPAPPLAREVEATPLP